jgi:hypothetical protein
MDDSNTLNKRTHERVLMDVEWVNKRLVNFKEFEAWCVSFYSQDGRGDADWPIGVSIGNHLCVQFLCKAYQCAKCKLREMQAYTPADISTSTALRWTL